MTSSSAEINHVIKTRDRPRHPVAFVEQPAFETNTGREFLNAIMMHGWRPGDRKSVFAYPKDVRGTTRPLSRSSLRDDIAIHCCVRSFGKCSSHLVHHNRYSWRPNPDDTPAIWEASPFGDRNPRWRRDRFEADVARMRYLPYCYCSDVQDDFGTTSHARLLDSMTDLYKDHLRNRLGDLSGALRTLGALLRQSFPSGHGVWQGSDAGFFLAEIPRLSLHDWCLDRGHTLAVWVDDAIQLGSSHDELVSQFDQYHAGIEALGQQLNPRKTFPTETRDLWIIRLHNRKSELEKRSSGLNAPCALRLLIQTMWAEVSSPRPCNHWLRYLVSAVGRLLPLQKTIAPELSSDLATIFDLHRIRDGSAVPIWSWILNSGANSTAVQKIAATILVNGTSLLDVEVAMLTDCFIAASKIKDANVANALRDKWLIDATYVPAFPDGGSSARNGKAFRALQRHCGSCADALLIEMIGSHPYEPEMYRYFAVASSDLPPTAREKALAVLHAQASDEERVIVEYFRHNRETICPARRRPVVGWNY
jgi:hypothetical protein